MDSERMAAAIAFELNKDCWKAVDIGGGEIEFTNEDGEKFILLVERKDEVE